MEILAQTTNQTEELAIQLSKKLKPGSVLALYGDLGSGKTTLTRFLAKSLGSDKRTQSPTFVIHRKYKCEHDEIKNIHHLDLYRLVSKDDVVQIGLEEFINDPKGITIIEWPEIAQDFLPNNTIRVYLEYVDEHSRKIKVENV